MSGNVDEFEIELAVPITGFGVWLRRTREQFDISQTELGRRAGVSNVTISYIETGRTQNPTPAIRESLVASLNELHQARAFRAGSKPGKVTEASQPPEDELRDEAEELSIPGLGSLESFDPFAIDQVPAHPGVYVFYDISDRPIYVGRSKVVRNRVRTHHDRFWFKHPLVTTAYFLRVDDEKLRSQIEKVLIQFLRSNAIVNKVYVDRDTEEQ